MVWQMFFCRRCGHPFRAQGIRQYCVGCIHAAAAMGVAGNESIGEVSGA